jgi:cytochrome d ubiquinol oxidase subunit I
VRVTALELARWQFGITTLYHFIFVPVTIGLAFCVAVFQTRWHRTGEEHWLRSTRFWGKLLLISFALGVATGIVQEFQFGMDWSNYSRFVGDIFGAPLAMEGLAAFFVESTFLGLWIFGWGRLSKRVHLACIWLVAGSTALSAHSTLAPTSTMPHPLGYRKTGHTPELTNIASFVL